MINNTARLKREAQDQFYSGDRSGGWDKLHQLLNVVTDPIERAWLAYQEITFLFDAGEFAASRVKLDELRRNPAVSPDFVADSDEEDDRVVLAFMILFAETQLLVRDGRYQEGLKVLEHAMQRYPRQLALPEVRENADEVFMLCGFLLADEDRCSEALPILEHVSPDSRIRELVDYYLGHCYFQLKRYKDSKSKLIESLEHGLSSEENWRARAHYTLGLAYYQLGEVKQAKDQFEMCLRVGAPEYLETTDVWKWLEVASKTLVLHPEARPYSSEGDGPQERKPN